MENQLPTIIEQSKSSGLLPKIIFGFLGLVIVAEIIFGIKTLTRSSSLPVLANLNGGSIALISGQKSIKVGDTFNLLIRESTGGRVVVGSDIDITYDPTLLEATSSASFYKGNMFDQYPITKFDSKKGEIKISAVTSPKGKPFEGVGIFGGIKFIAKANGNDSIKLNFTPLSTTTSTMVESGSARNILARINNYKVSINNSPDTQKSQIIACFPRVQKQCVDDMGRIGTQWCTSVLDSPTTCKSGCFTTQTGSTPGCNVVVIPGHK